jgi:diamine N-acetyltransferase
MLKGEKTFLRPLQYSDWQNTIKWRNDILIKRKSMMHPYPITEMIEKEWYENILKSKNQSSVYFTIINEIEEPIGFIILTKINQINKNCTLSIVIGESKFQSKGYGKEAMNLIIDYAFNTLNLRKISVEVLSTNEQAIMLYKKLGFHEEGILRQHFFLDGQYLDVYIMSLFKND